MTYLLFEEWGGFLRDVKKTVEETEDDRMCWAAAAANVLAWTGWGFPEGQSFQDETSIFQYFLEHWPDADGYPNFAWEWWFAGKHGNAPALFPEGGGFWDAAQYPIRNFCHVEEMDRSQMLPAIDRFLHLGYGIVLELIGPHGGHNITCWGIDQDGEGRYVGIHISDSDDPSLELVHYDVVQDTAGEINPAYPNWWYLTYRNGVRYMIGKVHALDRFPKNDPPAPPSGVTAEPIL